MVLNALLIISEMIPSARPMTEQGISITLGNEGDLAGSDGDTWTSLGDRRWPTKTAFVSDPRLLGHRRGVPRCRPR